MSRSLFKVSVNVSVNSGSKKIKYINKSISLYYFQNTFISKTKCDNQVYTPQVFVINDFFLTTVKCDDTVTNTPVIHRNGFSILA